MAATETSADRLSSSSRTLQALWEQPRCRTCAHHAAAPSTSLPHTTRTTLSSSRPARATGTTGDEKQRLAVLRSTPDVLQLPYPALERPHRRHRGSHPGTGTPTASTQDG